MQGRTCSTYSCKSTKYVSSIEVTHVVNLQNPLDLLNDLFTLRRTTCFEIVFLFEIGVALFDRSLSWLLVDHDFEVVWTFVRITLEFDYLSDMERTGLHHQLIVIVAVIVMMKVVVIMRRTAMLHSRN